VPAPSEPILFEALCSPPPSLGVRGFRVVATLIGGLGALIGAGFLWFGAWPVLGFFGLELVFAVGLLALHRGRTARRPEIVRLVGGTLQAGTTELSAYWTRVDLAPTPRGGSRLLLRDRARVVEIGGALGEADRRNLAAALRVALATHREPRFANAQLATGSPKP